MSVLDGPVVRFADQVPVSWRNGGGTTREILTGGAVETGKFDWRISVADVTEAGPFSTFPGVDRVLVLCRGTGMLVEVDGCVHHLGLHDAVQFAGEQATSATIPDGPTVDFNVMTRRDRVQTTVDVSNVEYLTSSMDLTATPGSLVLVVALEEVVLQADGRELALDPFDAVDATGSTCGLTTTGGRIALITFTSVIPDLPVCAPDRPSEEA